MRKERRFNIKPSSFAERNAEGRRERSGSRRNRPCSNDRGVGMPVQHRGKRVS